MGLFFELLFSFLNSFSLFLFLFSYFFPYPIYVFKTD